VSRPCVRKVRCRSRYEAMKLLAKVTREGLGPQRIYWCGECRGWHLTSRVRPWWKEAA
jgi:hypothetical protein